MMITRTLTAIVLLAIFLSAIFYPTPAPFTVCIILLVTGGAWEWARMNTWREKKSWLVLVGSLIVCVLTWYVGWLFAMPSFIWWIVSFGWLVLGILMLLIGSEGWRSIPPFVRNIGGFFALWVTYVSVIQAWMQGVNLLLSILVLAWVNDTGAYLVGRFFGGKFIHEKLAPSISPKKTWEGLIGGVAACLIMAYVWLYVDSHLSVDVPSFYSRIYTTNHFLLIPCVIFLSLMAVLGDLLESLCKRAAGIKDSGKIFPGHGGILDRVDSLLPILSVAMLMMAL